MAQTVDTDLDQHVRREYGVEEARILIEQMRIGVPIPCLSHEECMPLMLEVLSKLQLHEQAVQGYKSVGEPH